MSNKKYLTKSEKQTFVLAKKIVSKLKGGEVICLMGDLGAGKTAFTKGLAQALKVKNIVTSPTFVLLKIYKVFKNKKGIKNLIHLDCYRLGHAEELFAIGWEEFLKKKDSLIVVEWADKIKSIMPADTVWLNFRQGRGEEEREIKLKNQKSKIKILVSPFGG
jgi:tRNA threonylcarbamoyladenosine biosynthesis protein TsaE